MFFFEVMLLFQSIFRIFKFIYILFSLSNSAFWWRGKKHSEPRLTRQNSIWSAQLQRLASLETYAIENIDILLSRQQTLKVLMRLRGCTGWYAFLSFAYGKNRFSHDVAPLIAITSLIWSKQTDRHLNCFSSTIAKASYVNLSHHAKETIFVVWEVLFVVCIVLNILVIDIFPLL